jgi:hypothetical protein
MINKDMHTKHFPRIPRQQEGMGATLIAFAAMIACFTLMGWSCTDKYKQVPISQHIDKSNVKRLTAQQLAEQTALLNAEMEKRTKK